jgi:D-beta-D-heptose 7-phosphate kinase/D-beta-D-heptose 1-phosphate adenosyltransferase
MPVTTLEAFLPVVAEARAAGRRIVFTNGVFDILHRGHVTYLEQARALGDLLVVGVNTDDSVRRLKGPERPVNRLEDRAHVLAALRAVDWVVPFADDTPRALIEAITPHVLVKGGDYRAEEVVGGDWVLRHGGQVHIAPTVTGFSTTGIIGSLKPGGESGGA